MDWEDMKYWQSPDWTEVQRRLSDLDQKGMHLYNPGRIHLFKALELVPFNDVKVCIIAQDPYPKAIHATGVALSVPAMTGQFPVTLATLFKEYCNDLHYNYPKNGNLTKWCAEGVLLWNAIPTCLVKKSLSHAWPEWKSLTQEIVVELSNKGVVFVFLGGLARTFVKYIYAPCKYIELCHPSPRASTRAHHPFLGSRMFSTVNAMLKDSGHHPIDWKLN